MAYAMGSQTHLSRSDHEGAADPEEAAYYSHGEPSSMSFQAAISTPAIGR